VQQGHRLAFAPDRIAQAHVRAVEEGHDSIVWM
jgi:hypothetical protein